ncbi:MAG: VOC family protein [Campylobacterales bacterium]|nr:VOC family protein [Campylobacterales bacterium]
MKIKEDEPTVAVSLTVKNTANALEFYTRAFGAKELYRIPSPDGGIGHAEFMIGNTKIFISDESSEWHAFAMSKDSIASFLLSILTDSCDKSYHQVIEAGGKSLRKPQTDSWGIRTAVIKDPFGYRWSFREPVEKVII